MRKICKVLFSRYAISALMILAEVAVSIYLFMSIPSSVYSFIIAALILELIAFLNLINKDANPEYKASWSVVIFLLPIAGAVIYFIFYRRYLSKKEARVIERSIVSIRSISQSADAYRELCERDTRASGKARAILSDDPMAQAYKASEAKYFPTGEEYFESLISDIRAAERYIFLEYFIIDEGKLWDEIHALLVERAAAGVEIRLLFDDVGCMKTLPARYERELLREGILAHRFARVSARLSSMHHNRDHRKIAVIDGKIGYTGGVNIADEYVNAKTRFGHWKDGGIRLVGDGAMGLLKLFLTSWDVTVGTVSDYRALLTPTPVESDGGYYLPFGSGPKPIYRQAVAKNLFLNIINQAVKYVYITTPYLIIDYDLTEALCNAAKRGVDVRIVTPGVPDKRFVWIMTRSSYSYLIKGGVAIYEYEGFIHEKLLISDGEYAVIGTVNFDYRSLAHHFECGVWSYLSPICDVAHDGFALTLEKSKRITEQDAKPTFIQWIFKIFNRIFAPLL